MSEFERTKLWERYFESTHRFFQSPERFAELLELLGNHKEAEAFFKDVDALRERNKRWAGLWSDTKAAASWIAVVGGALGVLGVAWRVLSPLLAASSGLGQ